MTIQAGKLYMAEVGGKLVPVLITSARQAGGWNALNTVTDRRVRIRADTPLRPACQSDLVEAIRQRIANHEHELEER